MANWQHLDDLTISNFRIRSVLESLVDGNRVLGYEVRENGGRGKKVRSGAPTE